MSAFENVLTNHNVPRNDHFSWPFNSLENAFFTRGDFIAPSRLLNENFSVLKERKKKSTEYTQKPDSC